AGSAAPAEPSALSRDDRSTTRAAAGARAVVRRAGRAGRAVPPGFAAARAPLPHGDRPLSRRHARPFRLLSSPPRVSALVEAVDERRHRLSCSCRRPRVHLLPRVRTGEIRGPGPRALVVSLTRRRLAAERRGSNRRPRRSRARLCRLCVQTELAAWRL